MNHSPEPWLKLGLAIFANDDNHDFIARCADRGIEEDHANAERIVACVNFCRQFPTEFIKNRQMVYIKDKKQLNAVPAKEFVACSLIPVAKNSEGPPAK